MSDPIVSNGYASNNPDIPVRCTTTAALKQIQHMRLDIGTGSAEAEVNAANPLPVTVAGSQTSAGPTVTTVSAATSDTAVLAADTARLGCTFFNDSSATCYLRYGSGAASTSDYSVQIPPRGTYEPAAGAKPTWAFRAVWAVATGTLRVTVF